MFKVRSLKLKDEFICLCQNNQERTAEQKIALEKAKLSIIKGLEEDLTSIYAGNSQKIKEKKPKRFLLLKKAFYYFLLLFGLIEDAIGSFLFAQSFLILIPAIPNPVVLVGSILIALINCILFYAFEAAMFKDALGISATGTARGSLIDTYLEQVKCLEQVNQMFLFPSRKATKMYQLP